MVPAFAGPPLFQAAADSSGRDACELVGSASEASSIRTNPFIRRDAELKELSNAQLQKAPSPNPSDKFVRPHLSLPRKNIGRSLTDRPKSLSNFDDNAASEWETIAPAEELEERNKDENLESKQLKRKRNLEPVFHPHEALSTTLSSSASGLRRNTILGPPDVSLPKLPSGTSRAHLPGYPSFPSSSSFYTEIDGQDVANEQRLLDPDAWGFGRSISQRRPATTGGENQLHHDTPVRSISKGSSSTRSDPFFYDGGPYSAFLQPTAEREVSSALARAGVSYTSSFGVPHPVDPEEIGVAKVDDEIKISVKKKEQDIPTSAKAEPSRRLSGNIATLVRPRPENGTEADWQTVTTDHGLQPPLSHNGLLAKGTGSSLADVSDASGHEFCQCDNGSTDRIIQHPQHPGGNGSYHLRRDKQTNRTVLLPAFRDNQNTGFMSNSSRKPPQPQSRAVSAIRRFSNTFRRDHSGDRPATTGPRVFEMNSFGHSYDSLSSEYEHQEDINRLPERPAKQSRFQWSRIQESLSRSPPKSPLNVYDQPLYRASAGDDSPLSPRHDEFLGGIPRLPFPVISLPEAALMQRFRRERGEEDHTERGASFSAKARSGTVSTISSSQPRTPLSTWFDNNPAIEHRSMPTSSVVHHRPSRMNDAHRRTAMSEDDTEMPPFSAGMFDTPTSNQHAPISRKSWYKGGPYDSWTILGTGLPIFPGLSTSTKERRTRNYPGSDRSSTPTFGDPVSSAREDLVFRRRFSDTAEKRQKLIFNLIVVLTIFFAPAGVLALYGKFDNTISWYTHGELHNLTTDQRGTLKQQILVEGVLYPTLIITLAVYYSVHG